MNEQEDRMSAIKDTIEKLPKPHLDNLRYLMKFLQHLSKFTSSNKMTPQNIAMAIAPSLIWSPNNLNSTPAIDMAATNLHSLIVYNLVESAQVFFPEGKSLSVILFTFYLCRKKYIMNNLTSFLYNVFLFFISYLDVNLTTLTQFSQSERSNGSANEVSRKSPCDQRDGEGSLSTIQPPLRTKRIKKLAPRIPIVKSSHKPSASPSPRLERRSQFLRNNNDYDKLTNGSSCKQLDYSSSESTDQDVSAISYRVNDFDTASLDRKVILRSRTVDRTTVQTRRNSNRRSVSNVQRPNVPPPEIPKSPSSLSKPRSTEDLLRDHSSNGLNESIGSLCLNSTNDSTSSNGIKNTFDSTNSTITTITTTGIPDIPSEPPKKPPRKVKSQPNQKSIPVVQVTPEKKLDDNCIEKNSIENSSQVQNCSFESKSEDISTEENTQHILNESNGLKKVASSSSSSLLCSDDVVVDEFDYPDDVDDDDILTQDIPPPPLIPPPPPPPPSTPYDLSEQQSNLIVENFPLQSCSSSSVENYTSVSVDVKVKPPKPPPPPKPKGYPGVMEKSYL